MPARQQQQQTQPSPAQAAGHAALLQRKCACGNSAGLTDECAECSGRGLTLQRYATSAAVPPTVPPIVHDVLHSAGQPLDQPTRVFMESRFGHDFSKVRIHTDAQAAESAVAVSAKAYTVGHDVVFRRDAYTPYTNAGQRLLAHELAHVIQQQGRLGTAAPGIRHEHEADAAAEAVVQRGAAVRITGGSSIGLARQPDEPAALGPTITPAIKQQLIQELQNARLAAPKSRNIPHEANRTFATAAIIKPNGKVTYETAYFDEGSAAHAEPQLLNKIQSKIQPGDTVAIAIDQVPCPASRANCQGALKEFRGDPQHGSMRVYTVRALRKDAPPGVTPDTAGPQHLVGSKRAIQRPMEERFLVEDPQFRRVRLPLYKEQAGTPPPTGAAVAAGEGLGAVEGGTQQRGLLGRAASSLEGEEVEVEVVPGRRTRASAPSEGPGDLGPTPRRVVLGVALNFAAGIGVKLFTSVFRDKVESDLANMPRPKIDKRSAKGFLSDPATADSMRLIDILSKDLIPFGRELQAKHEELLLAAQLKLAAVSISALSPEARLEQLSDLGDDIDAYDNQLSTVADNLDAVLEQKDAAMKTAKACDDLRALLNTVYMEHHWIETGFSVEEHGQVDSNLANLAVTIRIAFRDAAALQRTIAKLEAEEQAFRKSVSVIYDQEFAVVAEALLKERAKAAAAKPTPPPSAPPPQQPAKPKAKPPELLPAAATKPEPPAYSPLAAIQPWEDKAKDAGQVASTFEGEKAWIIATEDKLRQLDHDNRRGSAEYKSLYQQFDLKRRVWPGQLQQSIAALRQKNAEGYAQAITRLEALADWLRNEGQSLLDRVLPPG